MKTRNRRPEEFERFAERKGLPVTVGYLARMMLYRLEMRRTQ